MNGNLQPGISIAPEINPNVTPPRKSGLRLFVALAGIAALVIALVLVGYAKGYTLNGLSLTTPGKTWEKFYSGSSAKIYNTTFKAGYSDPEALNDQENGFGLMLKNIKVDLEGTTYANLMEPATPEIEGNVKFTVGSGNTSFTSGIDYRAKNKMVYYKIGDIPILSALIGSENGNSEWIKIDLERAKEEAGSDAEFFNRLADPSFQEKIRQIWIDNRAIKLADYVGRETINGVSTFHFRAELDKDATKKAAMQTIAEIASLDNTAAFSQEDKALAEAGIHKLLTKIEVKELDVWVGIKDQNLYKIKLATNAPSLVSMIQLSQTYQPEGEQTSQEQQIKELEDFLDKLKFTGTFNFEATYSDYGKTKNVEEPAGAVDILGSVRDKSHDAKRVSDIRQMASALELLYNDANTYPESLSALSPTYISVLPTAPEPPSGSCTPAQNTYSYTRINAQSYRLSFCLGKETGGLSAGPHYISEAGIQ